MIKATLVTDPTKALLVEISSKDPISHLQLLIGEMMQDNFLLYKNL